MTDCQIGRWLLIRHLTRGWRVCWTFSVVRHSLCWLWPAREIDRSTPGCRWRSCPRCSEASPWALHTNSDHWSGVKRKLIMNNESLSVYFSRYWFKLIDHTYLSLFSTDRILRSWNSHSCRCHWPSCSCCGDWSCCRSSCRCCGTRSGSPCCSSCWFCFWSLREEGDNFWVWFRWPRRSGWSPIFRCPSPRRLKISFWMI